MIISREDFIKWLRLTATTFSIDDVSYGAPIITVTLDLPEIINLNEINP